MRSIKALGLAFAAVLALGAMASASASATELVLTKGTYPALFTSLSSRNAVLTSGGSAVTCTHVDNHGFLNSSKDASATITFLECTSSGLGCKTSGASGNTIVSELLILFNKLNGKPVLLFEKQEGKTALATFVCAGFINFEVTGSVNGLVTNRAFGEKASSMSVNVEVEGGKQKDVEAEEPNTKMELLANGGAATEEVKEDVITLAGGDEAEFK